MEKAVPLSRFPSPSSAPPQSSKTFLRKSVYVTVLFVCLSLAVFSTKVNHQQNSINNPVNGKSRVKRNYEYASDVPVRDEHPTTVTFTINTVDPPLTPKPPETVKPPRKGHTPKSATSAKKMTTTPKEDHSELPLGGAVEMTTPSTTTTRTTTTTTVLSSSTIASSSSKQPSTNPATASGFNSTSTDSSTTTPTTEACEQPAYHQFPEDLFSTRQKRNGFVVIHILVGIYMFFALAVVCDEYFVSSMEKICSKLGLSEDVAGATFMAAGSSAPELFASLLGVFVAKGDVGTGTIIGSAVFNILFVIGFCALLAGKVVALNWWPLIRDSAYYSIAVVVLISIMADGAVTWWESLLMLFFYAIYILIMKYNVNIHVWLTQNTQLRLMDEFTQTSQGILLADGKAVQSSYVQFNNYEEEVPTTVATTSTAVAATSQLPKEPREMALDEIIFEYPRKWSLYEAALRVMHSRKFSPRTRFICAALRVIQEWEYVRRKGYPKIKQITIQQVDDISHTSQTISDAKIYTDWRRAPSVAEQGVFGVIRWGVTTPVYATLHYTIPDCRERGWEKWFMFTFAISMLWIAFFSYILVWMVTLVGYTFRIPDTIMGITFLAAGTSIPDAYSSLLVAKQGLGDMAVSNSIGSNVFDILIGLALPWFLQTAIVEPGSTVSISSGGMVYNVILLFLSIITTIGAVHYARWQLNRRLGIYLMVAYSIFLFFSLLIEFNVFGVVNLPECEED